MIQDKAGRRVMVGQVVDLLLQGMMQAQVVHVEEPGVLERTSGWIGLMVQVQMPADGKDRVPCYVVREAPKAVSTEDRTVAEVVS